MPRYGYSDDRQDHDYYGRSQDGRGQADRSGPQYQQPDTRNGDYQDRGYSGRNNPGYGDRRQPVGYQPSYNNWQAPVPPPAPAKKRHWPLWAALGVLAVIVVACTAAVASSGGGSGTGTAGASSTSAAGAGGSQAQGLFQHPEDITISKCGTDDLGMMTAQIVVHNSSSKASDYSVQVAFQSVDGTQKYGDGYAIINTLAAGQQQPEQVQAFKEPPGQFKCVVISAQRTQAI